MHSEDLSGFQITPIGLLRLAEAEEELLCDFDDCVAVLDMMLEFVKPRLPQGQCACLVHDGSRWLFASTSIAAAEAAAATTRTLRKVEVHGFENESSS